MPQNMTMILLLYPGPHLSSLADYPP
jgi:hypothetical protein